MKNTMKLFALCATVLAFSAALASCQKEKATPEVPEMHVFHVELDATVADTKATYTTASKEITFESGDALYIVLAEPTSAAWSGAAGTLTYDGTSFKGDIAYTGTYVGSDIITDAKDLTATFLPKGYGSVNYLSATGEATATNAFYAGEKSASVPQLVHLTASITDQAGSAKSPLALSAQNAVLCYSINANKLSAGAHTVSVSDGTTTISGSVTAVADAATTFAVAFPATATSKDYTLRVPAYENVVKSGKTLAAGKVINISIAAIAPTFSVDAGKYVKFSPGNLQLVGENTWKFADNQWDYFGNTQSDNHRDLFGWGTGNNPNNVNTNNGNYATFSDWGDNTYLQSQLGTGWRTLTSAQWTYLLNTRTGTRYCKATVNSVSGLVIFPDSYSHPTEVTAVASANDGSKAFTTNSWSGENWTKMETAGAVFLPAAGYRFGTSVYSVGSGGYYWSSTPSGTDSALRLDFSNGSVSPASLNGRRSGSSVRLVQNQ